MSRTAVLAVVALLIVPACQKEGVGGWVKRVTHRDQTKSPVRSPSDMKGKKVDALEKLSQEGFLEKSAIGSEIGSDGNVSAQKESFVQGEPIYVTMNFHLSPPGLKSSLVVLDHAGKELHRDSKEMNGGKVVTFKVPPKVVAKPGTYEIRGLWGGNDACDYKVDVRGKRKS